SNTITYDPERLSAGAEAIRGRGLDPEAWFEKLSEEEAIHSIDAQIDRKNMVADHSRLTSLLSSETIKAFAWGGATPPHLFSIEYVRMLWQERHTGIITEETNGRRTAEQMAVIK